MLTAEDIARVCHEANRAYCMVIGDHSIPSWDMAPAWQKESTIAGVVHALAYPTLTPQESHAGWLAAKEKAGWKHGSIKRPEVLEHPCMLPWDQLPVEQWIKDYLFIAVVTALTTDLGVNKVGDAQVVVAVEKHEEKFKEEPANEGQPAPLDDQPVSKKKRRG